MLTYKRFFALLLTAALICSFTLAAPINARADEPQEETENAEEAEQDPRVTIVAPEEMPVVEIIPDAAAAFDERCITIIEGVSYDLSTHLSVSPSLDKVHWLSADPGVVTIDDNGVMTGMSIGSAWITATVGTVQARIYVYVEGNSMIVDPQEFMYYIKVNKSSNCITVYTLDENGEYTVPVRAFRCSTGKNTPNGKQKIRNHNAWNGLYGDYEGMWSSWIVSFFLFHSVPFYYRTHDSLNERMYNEFGTTCSGGCVRLQVINAKWIYDNCPVNTVVEFYYDDENPGPLGLPEAIKLPTGLKWDPTDPYEENPWLFGGEPVINGVRDITVQVGDAVDFFESVTGTDTVGNDVPDRLRVMTAADVNVPGDYTVIYSLTDASYKTVYEYCTLHVVE